jgi:hypothetical protein
MIIKHITKIGTKNAPILAKFSCNADEYTACKRMRWKKCKVEVANVRYLITPIYAIIFTYRLFIATMSRH